MPFSYQRTLHFSDTDAAGVVYFTNLLSICHEAYEASLAASGISLPDFFRNTEEAIPIVHASIDFRHPLCCGDQITVEFIPQVQSESEFTIAYQIYLPQLAKKLVATAVTRHLCIHPTTRTRHPLSPLMRQWLISVAALT